MYRRNYILINIIKRSTTTFKMIIKIIITITMITICDDITSQQLDPSISQATVPLDPQLVFRPHASHDPDSETKSECIFNFSAPKKIVQVSLASSLSARPRRV